MNGDGRVVRETEGAWRSSWMEAAKVEWGAGQAIFRL